MKQLYLIVAWISLAALLICVSCTDPLTKRKSTDDSPRSSIIRLQESMTDFHFGDNTAIEAEGNKPASYILTGMKGRLRKERRLAQQDDSQQGGSSMKSDGQTRQDNSSTVGEDSTTECGENEFAIACSGVTCRTCDEACVPGQCVDYDGCLECQQGFYSVHLLEGSPLECRECLVENCAECLSGEVDCEGAPRCVECVDGYFFDENSVCVPEDRRNSVLAQDDSTAAFLQDRLTIREQNAAEQPVPPHGIELEEESLDSEESAVLSARFERQRDNQVARATDSQSFLSDRGGDFEEQVSVNSFLTVLPPLHASEHLAEPPEPSENNDESLEEGNAVQEDVSLLLSPITSLLANNELGLEPSQREDVVEAMESTTAGIGAAMASRSLVVSPSEPAESETATSQRTEIVSTNVTTRVVIESTQNTTASSPSTSQLNSSSFSQEETFHTSESCPSIHSFWNETNPCLRCGMQALPEGCPDSIGCLACFRGFYRTRESFDQPFLCEPCNIPNCSICQDDVLVSTGPRCEICEDRFVLNQANDGCIAV